MLESLSHRSLIAGRYVIARLMRLDIMLLAIVVTLTTIGFIALFSASYSFPWRIEDQIRNITIAATVMLATAMVPVKALQKVSLPLFLLGCALLVLTLAAGVTVKGATRWLNVGVRIQPSEIMKLAVPMMLAWYYSVRGDSIRWWDHLAAFAMMVLPVALIMKQPDLGTSVLVAVAGFAVIFFAGLPKKVILAGLVLFIVSLPFAWTMLHDYQRERIMTLIDPTTDPLGKGFHIIQALIAIGSGGFTGKGWMSGTQAHLDFIPERTSDFLFAVFGEEFGFVGNIVLLILYASLIGRSFYIAAYAQTRCARLLAAAIGVIFFTYTFVNMGMVSGILPVVGVPLPFMSYGGTALMILGVCCGILLSISAESRS
jgi:rod shape determining protein RodA